MSRLFRPAPLLVLLGVALLLLVWPNGGPISGLDGYGVFRMNDLTKSYVAAVAAMHDPIDWAHPLAISTLRYPFGTSLLLADALPLLTLPLRLLWQAGLRIDPAIALDLWVSAMLLISPFATYRLARALGASERAGLLSALLGALNPALRIWFSADRPPYGSQGLAAWPLVALLFAELLDERSGRRRLAAPLIAGALWWANPYLGLVGGAVVALQALRLLRGGDRGDLLPLCGSLVGLVLLRMADLPLSDGVVIERFGDFLSVVPGLLPWDASLDHPRLWWVWDGLSLVLFLAAQPLLWRRSRMLLAGAWLLALISLGSQGDGGGLLPSALFTATPLVFVEAVDRLFLAAALLGVVASPALIERLLTERPRRSRLPVIPLALTLAVTVGGWGATLVDRDLRWLGERAAAGNLVTPSRPMFELERNSGQLDALRELVGAHERVLFLPDTAPDCDTPTTVSTTYGAAMSQKMGIAWIASSQGIPAYSFYTSRLVYPAADDSLRQPIIDGVACEHMRRMPPAGTLVAVNPELEALTQSTTPWRLIPARLARCSAPIESELLGRIRFCTDRPETIERFERRLRSLPELEP
jgi:hypothetical protein